MSFSRPFTYRFTAMTVPCEVQLFTVSDAARIAKRIESNTARLEKKFNFYDPDSWLNVEVNRRMDAWVTLDDEATAVFEWVKQMVAVTGAAFDPCVGTIKALVKAHPSLSKQAVYQRAHKAMGVDAWLVDEGRLHIPHRDTQFDLGGVIKEFAVDQAVLIAQRYGVSSALVNFGGDIRALGSKPDGSPFQVAVLNPKDKTEPFFSLPLANAALTTSAHYERRQSFSDQNCSHILSQCGPHPQVLSVSVLAPTALQAGILSTALTLNPTLPVPQEVGVVFIDDQLAIHQDTEFVA
ncbi:FAD:protein FMN transferase [Vibrio ostreicida]|uniref:FAD:protein FMN transferase n=1 Tax=Vibrio ostreicida TaxID=526588 RepID=A0ABT8C1S4_9VIBR|nr:FAD:protein FMN transferase [Vibrio ostreicida]MDN3612292.1 FAD:protein FMN transferase [Vibrio ostreicida]NPD08675.1 FAD:protein FMN transferase [Vibrio ostreicida]